MARWCIVITAEDGASEAFGSWTQWSKANAIHASLLDYSARYGGDGPEFEAELVQLRQWPGIRKFKEEVQ